MALQPLNSAGQFNGDWSQLTPDQQAALRAALGQVNPGTAPVTHDQALQLLVDAYDKSGGQITPYITNFGAQYGITPEIVQQTSAARHQQYTGGMGVIDWTKDLAGLVGVVGGGLALAGGLGGAGGAGAAASTTPYIAPGASITGAPLAAGGGAAAATTAPYVASGASITGSALGAGGGAAGAAGAASGAAGAGGGMSSWLNWLNLGNSVLGAVGANSGAKAQEKGNDAAIAESRRQFDTTRADFAPSTALLRQSATQLGDLNSGNMSGFYLSPDYQFNLAQGQQAGDRRLAAMGLSDSGPAVKESERFASGLASGEYNQFYNHLLASAGLGTTGASTSAQAGAQSAAQVGNASQASGNARASGYANMYGALQGGIQNDLLRRYLNTGP